MADSHKSLAEAWRAGGVEASRSNMFKVPPEALTLVTDPTHYLFDPRVNDPVDEAGDFFRSIMGAEAGEGGVRQSIFVQKDGQENGKPRVLVVAGRQRVKAALRANVLRRAKGWPLLSVPVIEVKGSPGEMILIALEENALRKQESPFTLAVKASQALKLGQAEKQVARACGVGLPVLLNYLELLNMDAKVQQAFHSGALGVGVIQEFAKVPRAEQRARLEVVQASGAAKNHEVKAALQAADSGRAYTPSEDRKKSRGRGEVEAGIKRLYEGLPAPSGGQTSTAVAVLQWALGKKSALDDFPKLQMLLEPAEEPAPLKGKKKGKGK